MDNIIQNGDGLDNFIQNEAKMDNIIRQNQFLDNDWGGRCRLRTFAPETKSSIHLLLTI